MQMIKAELVLWVAGFVLLSLIVNAPMLPWLLRILRLNIGTLLVLAAAPLQCFYGTSVRLCGCYHSLCWSKVVSCIPAVDQAA